MTMQNLFETHDPAVFFRTLAELSTAGISVVDSTGVIKYINPAYERLINAPLETMIGMHFSQLIYAEDLPLAFEMFRKINENPGQLNSIDSLRLLRADGSICIIEGTAQGLPNGDLVSFIYDITKLKQTEAALRDLNAELENRVIERTTELETALSEQRKLAAIIEAAPDYIGVADLEGYSLYVNKNGRRMIGKPEVKQDDTPWHVSQCYPEDERPALADLVGTMLRGEVWSGESRLLHQDGHEIPVAQVCFPVFDKEGNIEYLAAIIRDITEQKQVEQELKQAKEAAEAALAEQKRLIKIIEATSDLVAVVSPQGHGIYLNRAGRELMGIGRDEDVAHVNLMSHYSPQALKVIMEKHVPQAIANGGAWTGENTLLDRHGREIPISQAGLVILGENGEVEYLATIARDITASKRLEAELRQAKEAAEAALAQSKRLTAIIESSPDMIGITDMQGRVIYINSSTRRNLGVEDDEDITQLTLMDFYAPQAQETLLNVAIPAAIRDGSWSGESAVINRKDGRVIPVSLVGVVHRGSDGTPEFMSGVNRDISDRKRFEAEIQQAREAAETANRAKSTFLANMSHEIRTPMNAIIGMTSLLLETALNVKQRDFVETIRVSGDGLLTIINDILDFSKIEADKLELVYRPLDVRDCIESSLDLLAPHAAEKNLDMAYVMDPSTPTGIVGDVTRLRQVLVNLIGNAVKFTRAGEVVVTVTANPAPNPDSQMKNRHILHFTVRDTGIGIPQDKRDRLFKSFSQIDSSNTREFGGTGLGLAISKRLVELMGGAMWVESEGLGRGSTFHFTIVAEAIPALHQTNLQRPQPELRGKRVLIVDDNATNRRILSLQTQTWGMQAHEVETPADALHLLARSSFDVAILDMHMPEMDGLQLARAIQQSGVAQTMPLIMLTSVSLNQEMSDLFQASLTKPVKPSELYNILLNVLVGSPSETLKTYHQLNSVSQNVQPLAERYPMRILLAEDVVVNQKFALHALERIGYRADVVANGAEAVAALQRQPYHVILMDVQMPVMDGLEATRRIRTLDVIQPHIIAMTANAMQGDREICLEAGMDDYISKPVYLHELQAALERAGDRLSARMSLTEFTETPELDIMQFVDEDIIAAFVEEIPQITERLRRGVETGNAKEIRLAAHQIKGSCAYVGAKQVEELSAMLEQMGRDNYLVDAPRIFAQLEAALVIVLSQWVK